MSNKCINDIIKAAGGLLTKKEAGDLLRTFNERLKGAGINERAQSLRAVLENARSEQIHIETARALHNKLTAYNYKQSVASLASELAKVADEVEAHMKDRTWGEHIADFMQGPGGPVLRALDTVMTRKAMQFQGIQAHFMIFLDSRILRDGLMPYFKDHNTVMEAAQLLFDPNAKVSAPAQKIGAILRDALDLSVARLNESGHYVPHSNRVLFSTRVADAAKIKALGYDHFKARMMALGDPEFLNSMPADQLELYMQTAYRQLAGEHTKKLTAKKFDGVKGLTKSSYKNLAKSGSAGHDMGFRDFEAFQAFWAEYAPDSDTLGHYLMQRMDQIGRSVALNDVFGPVPEAAVLDAIRTLESRMTPEEAQFLTIGDPDSPWQFTSLKPVVPEDLNWLEGVGQYIEESMRPMREFISTPHPLHMLREMDGTTGRVIDGTAARMDYSIRALASMASLSKGFFMQLTDLPVRGAVLSKFGISGVEGFMQVITGIADAMPSAERKIFYAQLGVGFDVLHRTMVANLQGTSGLRGGMTGFIAGLSDIYFKANLMGPTDRVTKQATATFLASHIAGFVFDPKNTVFRKTGQILADFGIEAADYATLKQATRSSGGLRYIDPMALEKLNPKLYEKFLAVIQDTINTATPTPTVRERAITHKGTMRGTWENTTLNVLMMFKSFPILFATRILPAVLREETGVGLAQMMVGMFFAWYFGDTAKRAFLGQDPRRLDDPATWGYGALRSGLGGLYSDFMFAEYDKHGMDLASSLGGPVIGKINTLASLGSAAAHGRYTNKQLYHAARSNLQMPTVLIFAQQALERQLLGAILDMGDPGGQERFLQELEAKHMREEVERGGF